MPGIGLILSEPLQDDQKSNPKFIIVVTDFTKIWGKF